MDRTNMMISFLMIIAVFTLWGCPKKSEVSSAPETPPQKVESSPVTPAVQPAAEVTAKEASAGSGASLQPIYFDFDKSFIRDDSKEAMKANAAFLKGHPKEKITIEGNCDERGTIEYNQALGQRRAASAKKYLTDLGISGKRIQLISYGKEKPVCSQSAEECWQKDRRDDFVMATH